MADENKLIVQIELDDGTIKKGFLTLEKQGKRTGENLEGSFSKAFNFKALAAGAAIAAAGIGFISKAIKEAANQQESVNKLNTALKLTGKFSEESSKSLQNFASKIQDTTVFGDELTLETAALIQTLGDLDEKGLKRATKAALDFSTATGVDARAAAQLLGKAASGEISSFTRYGIVLKKGADNAETLERALGALEKKFGGSSEAALNTFAGSLASLNNNFGDFFEPFGDFIIKSPAIIGFIGGISKGFKDLASNLLQGISFNNFNRGLTDAILFISVIAKTLVDTVAPPIEFISNLIEALLVTLKNIGDVIFFSLGEGFIALGQALSGNFVEAGKTFTRLKLSIQQDIREIAETTSDENLLDFKFSNATSEFISSVINGVSQATASLSSFDNQADTSTKNIVDTLKIRAVSFSDVVDQIFFKFDASTAEGLEKLKATVAQETAQIASLFKQTIGGGVSQAFAAFGKAVQQGENGLKALGDSVLSTLGSLALQLGQFFILVGAGLTGTGSLFGLSGGAAIAAGIGLSVLGGVLQGISGGGGSGASGVSAGTSPVDSGPDFGNIPEPQPSNQINITVQGSILDSIDTGRRLAELINAETDRSGNSVLRFT